MNLNLNSYTQTFLDSFYTGFKNFTHTSFPELAAAGTEFGAAFISPLVCQISQQDFDACRSAISAFQKLRVSPSYLEWAAQGYASHQLPTAPEKRSLFGAYDFHLSANGPKLIEINTNAGFALGLYHANQWRRSFAPEKFAGTIHDAKVLEKYLGDFKSVFGEMAASGTPGTSPSEPSIAIVDENPPTQALYFEFLLFQKLLREAGLDAIICDPAELRFEHGQLSHGASGRKIGAVYNRLTDFYLRTEKTKVLRAALQATSVDLLHNSTRGQPLATSAGLLPTSAPNAVSQSAGLLPTSAPSAGPESADTSERLKISPHPFDFYCLADKSRLLDFSRAGFLKQFLGDSDCADIQKVLLASVPVNEADQKLLWEKRKNYFFKPFESFGGRAVYQGRGVTKTVWEHILTHNYIAQELCPAPKVSVSIDNAAPVEYKFDLRFFVFGDEIRLVGARFFQGQTTNFKTPLGGFGSVLITDSAQP